MWWRSKTEADVRSVAEIGDGLRAQAAEVTNRIGAQAEAHQRTRNRWTGLVEWATTCLLLGGRP